MKADDRLIKSLEDSYKELAKALKSEAPLDMKVKVLNAGIALAKVKHAISEKEDGADFNPDFDGER